MQDEQKEPKLQVKPSLLLAGAGMGMGDDEEDEEDSDDALFKK